MRAMSVPIVAQSAPPDRGAAPGPGSRRPGKTSGTSRPPSRRAMPRLAATQIRPARLLSMWRIRPWVECAISRSLSVRGNAAAARRAQPERADPHPRARRRPSRGRGVGTSMVSRRARGRTLAPCPPRPRRAVPGNTANTSVWGRPSRSVNSRSCPSFQRSRPRPGSEPVGAACDPGRCWRSSGASRRLGGPALAVDHAIGELGDAAAARAHPQAALPILVQRGDVVVGQPVARPCR